MISDAFFQEMRCKFGSEIPLLLFFWVGPVQEFIKEARKVKDLWNGSKFLNQATKQAMQPLYENPGDCYVLLPYLPRWNLDPEYSLPNHFVALIKKSKQKDIIQESEKRLKNYLPDLVTRIEILKNIKDIPEGIFQLEDHFQFMWVGFPVALNDLQDNYSHVFRKLLRLMEERKLTRTFSSWRGIPVDKCSQCGRREILGTSEFQESLKARWACKTKPGERLCAMCLLKRVVILDQGSVGFESTSDIAASPFRQTLLKNEGSLEVANFLNCIKLLAEVHFPGVRIESVVDIPGDLLYEEGLRCERLRREYHLSSVPGLEQAASKAQKALQQVQNARKQKACKYYAIIAFDADNMGKYLSGDIPEGTRFNITEQNERSKRIYDLSLTYSEIVTQWGQDSEFADHRIKTAQTIFSGGDDFLAFGPLEGILNTVDALHEEFAKTISGTTTSGALVIVHHHDPLKWAIREAREALEHAKEKYGRDALAISLRLSAGSYLACGFNWTLRNSPASMLELIKTLVRWMRAEKRLSPAFVHDLNAELDVFYREGVLQQPEMLKSEVERLFNRHIPKGSPIWQANETNSVLNVRDSIVQAADQSNFTRGIIAQNNMSAILSLAAFLARQEVNL